MKKILAGLAVCWIVGMLATAAFAAGEEAVRPPGGPSAGEGKKPYDQMSDAEKKYEATRLTPGQGWAIFGASLGAGLAVVGGGIGVGRIGAAILEAIARQPEATGSLFSPMIITAAMVEGGMLFAIVVALLGFLHT